MAKLRNEVWERDEGKCQSCGRFTLFGAPQEWDSSFHLAHIGAKRRHGDSPENTQVLCGGCHRQEHQWGKSRQKPCPKK